MAAAAAGVAHIINGAAADIANASKSAKPFRPSPSMD